MALLLAHIDIPHVQVLPGVPHDVERFRERNHQDLRPGNLDNTPTPQHGAAAQRAPFLYELATPRPILQRQDNPAERGLLRRHEAH